MFKKFISFSLFVVTSAFTNAQDLSTLFNQVNGSVVVIQTKEKVLINSGGAKTMMTSAGMGSGVLISEDEILTAAHVVSTTENIKVEFLSGEKIPAEIITSVKMADVALLKLLWKPKNPVIAKIGDSDEMNIGQEVFVIGTPYGLTHSLSVGHISSRHGKNSIAGGFNSLEFFQTDAAINQGNSGGPMFNMSGEVVAVCSFILTQSGGFEGLGFAATSNIASQLLLNEDKPFWHGMDGKLLTGELAKIFNLPQAGGILVQKVVTLSPAGLTGLQGGQYTAIIEGQELVLGGDIILAFDKIEITSDENIAKIYHHMIKLKPGEAYTLTVLRGGVTSTLNGTVP